MYTLIVILLGANIDPHKTDHNSTHKSPLSGSENCVTVPFLFFRFTTFFLKGFKPVASDWLVHEGVKNQIGRARI